MQVHIKIVGISIECTYIYIYIIYTVYRIYTYNIVLKHIVDNIFTFRTKSYIYYSYIIEIESCKRGRLSHYNM